MWVLTGVSIYSGKINTALLTEPGNEARPKKVVQLWRQMLSATEAATSNTAQEPTDAFSGRH